MLIGSRQQKQPGPKPPRKATYEEVAATSSKAAFTFDMLCFAARIAGMSVASLLAILGVHMGYVPPALGLSALALLFFNFAMGEGGENIVRDMLKHRTWTALQRKA